MGHNTLIGGSMYKIIGGQTLIDGTVYDIKNGKTLVGGAGRNIEFNSFDGVIFNYGCMLPSGLSLMSAYTKTVNIYTGAFTLTQLIKNSAYRAKWNSDNSIYFGYTTASGPAFVDGIIQFADIIDMTPYTTVHIQNTSADNKRIYVGIGDVIIKEVEGNANTFTSIVPEDIWIKTGLTTLSSSTDTSAEFIYDISDITGNKYLTIYAGNTTITKIWLE